METIEQKRKDWLDSHLKIYIDDPKKRSLDEAGACAYRGLNGCKCIIGQDIPDDKYKSGFEGYGLYSMVIESLPQSTLDLGIDFLIDCQQLHDRKFNWTEKGLSKKGKGCYDRIIETYCTEN